MYNYNNHNVHWIVKDEKKSQNYIWIEYQNNKTDFKDSVFEDKNFKYLKETKKR
jgi:hypothetical protein